MSDHNKIKVKVTNYLDLDMTTHSKVDVQKGKKPTDVLDTIPGDDESHTLFEVKSKDTDHSNQGQLFYNLPGDSTEDPILTIFYHNSHRGKSSYIIPQYCGTGDKDEYFLRVRNIFSNKSTPRELEADISIHRQSAQNLSQGDGGAPKELHEFTTVIQLTNKLVGGVLAGDRSYFITLNSFPHPSHGYKSQYYDTWGNLAVGAALADGGVGVVPGATNTLLYAGSYGTDSDSNNLKDQKFEWSYNVGDGQTMTFSFKGGQNVFKHHPPELEVFFSHDNFKIIGAGSPSFDSEKLQWTFNLVLNYV